MGDDETLKTLYESTFEELERLSDSVRNNKNHVVDLSQVERTSFWKRDNSREEKKREARKEKLLKRIRKDVVINSKPSYFFKSVGRNVDSPKTSLPSYENVSSLTSHSPSFTFSKTSREGKDSDRSKNDRMYIGPKNWYQAPLTDEEEIRSLSEFLSSPPNTLNSCSLEEHAKAISQQRRLRRRALARMIQIRRGHSHEELRLSSSRRNRDRRVYPFGTTVRRFYEE